MRVPRLHRRSPDSPPFSALRQCTTTHDLDRAEDALYELEKLGVLQPLSYALELWEHAFVTSQGHAYARFRHALDQGNPTIALAAAADLEHVGLLDALELVLLLARYGDERRFRFAAVRWHVRYMSEVRGVDAPESTAVLGLVTMLNGPRRRQAACALAQLLDRRDLVRAGELLLREADGAGHTRS